MLAGHSLRSKRIAYELRCCLHARAVIVTRGVDVCSKGVVGIEGVGEIIDLAIPARAVEGNRGCFGFDPAKRAVGTDSIDFWIRGEFHHFDTRTVGDICAKGDACEIAL